MECLSTFSRCKRIDDRIEKWREQNHLAELVTHRESFLFTTLFTDTFQAKPCGLFTLHTTQYENMTLETTMKNQSATENWEKKKSWSNQFGLLQVCDHHYTFFSTGILLYIERKVNVQLNTNYSLLVIPQNDVSLLKIKEK